MELERHGCGASCCAWPIMEPLWVVTPDTGNKPIEEDILSPVKARAREEEKFIPSGIYYKKQRIGMLKIGIPILCASGRITKRDDLVKGTILTGFVHFDRGASLPTLHLRRATAVEEQAVTTVVLACFFDVEVLLNGITEPTKGA